MHRLATLLVFAVGMATAELPDGYWGTDLSKPILDSTLVITLDPDLSHLSAAELRAVDELIAAGHIINDLYEAQKHAQARSAAKSLRALHEASGRSQATQNLLDLWYLSKGPVTTTLDNERLAFVPVGAELPGRNFYPGDITRDEVDRFLADHADAMQDILHVRTVVRRASQANLAADLARLAAYPEIDGINPGLKTRLESIDADENLLYAVPYALAHAPELRQVRVHLHAAADAIAEQTPDFAAYLRHRARDLLSSDYEAGDASWVSGDFDGINAAIGSYETYDDKLFSVKAAFGLSILARDAEKSRALQRAMTGLQAIEDSLPYKHHKTVRSRIPVSVYNVIADFGQSRGGNTATILPNEASHARKYGRTILLRSNIMTNPALFAGAKRRFDAVVDACCRDDLTLTGGFNRTLWHEVGHYLGVSVTEDGRDLDSALADFSNVFEEMKADLVSLYAAPSLNDAGNLSDDELRSMYASGILRTLQIVKPRRDQPYQTMQLMQFNFFVENGLIEADDESGLLEIHYDRYHVVVTDLLEQVLEVQSRGDTGIAKQFVDRWFYWSDELHGKLAERMQNATTHRFRMVRFKALED